jgi:hypothetical protein
MKVLRSVVAVLVIAGMVEVSNQWGKELASAREYVYAQQGDKPVKGLAQQQIPQRQGPWEKLPEVDIAGKWGHSALLWGSKMVIWGGGTREETFLDGTILDLKTKKWELLEPDIVGRYNHTALLWGSKMVIWKGKGAILDLEKLMQAKGEKQR